MTAKEFLENEYEAPLEKINLEGTHAKFCMIEFAKYHVKAALESSHKNNQLPKEDLEFTLQSYPLTNIK